MLQNLKLLVDPIKEIIDRFICLDCELPVGFTSIVSKVNNDIVNYGKTTSLITNRNGQRIFIGNSWFYLAAIMQPLYAPLMEYRERILQIVPKDILKSKDPAVIKTAISNSAIDGNDKELLINFATDYGWWSAGMAKDGKSLDRNDCLRSGIISLANVVNDSQSYIGAIWEFFGGHPDYAAMLNDEVEKYLVQKTEIIKNKTLNSFVLEVFKYLHSVDKFSKIRPFFNESTARYASDATIIKLQRDDLPNKLVGLFIETSIDDLSKRNTPTVRWHDVPFEDNERIIYLSTQWNESGDFQLTLESLKRLLSSIYDNKYIIEKDADNNFVFYELSNVHPIIKNMFGFDKPLQQIFYGAPGTGKSHTIETETKGKEVIRVTFHPDSDYSTFVGAYKPTTVEVPIRDVTGKVIKENGEVVTETRIVYKYVPQAFLKAYVKAWKNLSEPVYLVIEEINRGNCAQIFGDIFQLLDRNENGYSSYEVDPDMDITAHLKKEFDKGIDANASDKVKNGEKMVLPPNLFIWATMNTSDQSLFPIDSAFKRRWDWVYMPIDTKKENWTLSVNGKPYNWTSFLDNINSEIYDLTKSEDKMLGFYFCKAEDNKITADRFVSKVLFYLYNDVFKDYGLDSREFFKDKENGDKVITFQNLYKANGSVNKELVEKLLVNLNVDVVASDKTSEEDVDDEGPTEGRHLFLKAVEFDDKTFSIEDGLTHFSVYLETLKKIGIPNVVPVIEASKYKRKGCKLATKVQEDGIINSRFSYVEVDGYYIVKGAADETLINVLEEVKEKLNLEINILTYRNVLNN